MNPIDPLAAYGLLAHAVIFGAFAALPPFGELRPRIALAASTLALLIGIAPTLHGIFGPPSVTLLLLAVLHLAERPAPLPTPAAGACLLLGVLLLAGGNGGLPDLFSTGLAGFVPGSAVALLGGWLWWRKDFVWPGVLGAGVAAWGVGLFDNLWQALIDPLLVLFALALLLRATYVRFSVSRLR